MPPTTRSRSQRSPFHGDGGPTRDPYRDEASDDEASDASMEEDEDDEKMVIRSPTTNIRYDISSLDPDTQAGVRQIFRESPTEETPQLVLQWCQSVQEQQDGQFYAFQMHEVVRKSRAIRIGSTQSNYRKPWCNCMGNSDKPCKHLIFLLDQLTHHTSGQILPEEPVHLANGTEGDNNPFESISSFHLDLLASKLHSDVGPPDSRPAVNPVRLQETREILVSIVEPDIDDYCVKEYRPDIFEDPDTTFENNDVISYNDLTRTVANMLMTNNEFFAYFLKLLGPDSRAGNPFRKIQQHIDRVLGELDSYARNPSSATNAAEGPRNVPWAAAHITRAVSAIQSLLQNRPEAPSPTERAAAARALVRILHTVILDWNRDVSLAPGTITITTTAAADRASSSSNSSNNRPPPPRQGPQEKMPPAAVAAAAAAEPPPLVDRNLYQRLIGSQTHTSSAFVIDVLAQLPEQNQWIETLEEIEGRLGEHNPPAGYMGRLRDLIALMRSSRPAVDGPAGPGAGRTGGKRRGPGGNGREGGAKRAR